MQILILNHLALKQSKSIIWHSNILFGVKCYFFPLRVFKDYDFIFSKRAEERGLSHIPRLSWSTISFNVCQSGPAKADEKRWFAWAVSSLGLECALNQPQLNRGKHSGAFWSCSPHVAFLSNQLSSERAACDREMHIHKWHQSADWCSSFFHLFLQMLTHFVLFQGPALHLHWWFIIIQ